MLSPVFIALLLISAEDAKEEAKALVDRGNKAFALEDYQGALESFERAYELYPSPKILVNLGETHRALGNSALAVSHFERYLSEVNRDDPAVPQIEMRVAELEAKVARIVIEAEDAEISIDGELVLGTRFVVSPGEHRVVATRDGHLDFARTISVGAGSTETVRVVLERLPSEAPPPPAITEVNTAPPEEEDGSIAGKWWFWLGAIAVAAGVAGVVVGVALNTGGDDFVPSGELPRATTSNWETF